MKPMKLSGKQKCLAKNSELEVEQHGGIFRIVLNSRTGKFFVGEGKTEDGAWDNCAKVWYNIK